MNIMKLDDMDAIEKFLDFSHVPFHPDYFPLDEQNKIILDKFYKEIPL